MIKLRDLENYVNGVNRTLTKIQFKLGHQYDYYTIELYVVEFSNKLVDGYSYKGNIFGGTKQECYNFLNSFMSILSLGKIEI